MSGDDDGLHDFVASRLPHLRRSAFLMCGDWELATELTRACLARVVADTRRGAVADPDVYAYAELMEACRRRNRRREHVFVAAAGAEGVAAESILLLDALHKLTPRCRAVLVLRHWDGFDTDAVGAMLDLDDERVAAYERAGLSALQKLLIESEAALTG
ncbi:DNA-directed RNA polymerase specialized sigma24 family protein [Actinoplanes tereljensis]|uniref:RNA polymerase sigma24 factor n=1 Tax=Paractinoplanes tereljensis TaxID=571912 RepID=A0A919TS30_9ACTN|nr:sigma factor-like helix-turn-helix DNA-binding protein [Actinoplanes tereljensis]GIF20958.1 RNA polymerase sigma24 factor [Actinoplanes tereljensis]